MPWARHSVQDCYSVHSGQDPLGKESVMICIVQRMKQGVGKHGYSQIIQQVQCRAWFQTHTLGLSVGVRLSPAISPGRRSSAACASVWRGAALPCSVLGCICKMGVLGTPSVASGNAMSYDTAKVRVSVPRLMLL